MNYFSRLYQIKAYLKAFNSTYLGLATLKLKPPNRQTTLGNTTYNIQLKLKARQNSSCRGDPF